jgi:hypothetical protein
MRLSDSSDVPTPATDVLAELAAANRARVKPANLILSEFRETLTAVCRIRVGATRVEVYAGPTLLSAEIALQAPITLALGKSDHLVICADKPVARVMQTEVSAGAQFVEEVRALLRRDAVRRVIEDLQIDSHEQLLIARNRSALTVRARDAASLSVRLTAAIDLLHAIGPGTPASGVEELPSIPEVPREAVAGLSRWAISDDGDREEALANASDAELSELAGFLDEWGDAVSAAQARLDDSDPEGAASWGSLAETAAEAKQELHRRRG